ncbi:NACHT domain-containing protein [uncultured Tateyamaria sp.]|uniref:NACHT domain-containing protein n=1 Tax=Tateyamaria sp. 1078 TaxID=3417464 RepID=UPI0026148B0C|nr:NACHT domain-containing protein [uncultured Tateyamaria sp.]
MDKALLDEKNFEAQIIRICDQIFSPYSDRRINYIIDGIEHDGYYETDLVVHVVEVTVSQKKSKAAHDLDKLRKRISELQREFRGSKPITGWFITKFDLAPEQRELLRTYPSNIRHQSYRQFVSRVIDSAKYLSARSHYRFGSAVDLFRESQDFETDFFVQTSLSRIGNGKKKKPIQLDVLKSWIDKGSVNRVLLLGDFGTGKSMHMRELFLHLAKAHTSGRKETFPVALNLRDFANLESPDEALRRHADRIGVRDLGEPLIRAWRAGYVTLLIDGFDEMVPRLSLRRDEKYFDIRRQALLVVRRLVSESPENAVIVIAGRSHFFPTFEEAKACLGVNESWEQLELSDIATEVELTRFLQKYNANFQPPDWLPRRPLLLGYLAVLDSRKSLGEISTLDASVGWKLLLDRFCQREVDQIDMLPLIKKDLLEIYGELATVARKRGSGVGPITTTDLTETYRNVFGDEPEGVVLGELMRLPGLVQAESMRFEASTRNSPQVSIESKNFMSPDFVDVCSATYLSNLFQDYADFRLNAYVGIKNPLGIAGIETLSEVVFDADKCSPFLSFINNKSQDNHSQLDLLHSMIYFGTPYKGAHIEISNCDVSTLILEKVRENYSRIQFHNCYFEKIIFDYVEDDSLLPVFSECVCEQILAVGSQALKFGSMSGCEVELAVNRESDLVEQKMTFKNVAEQIVYDVLRKTYEQSGPRVEKALLSGNAPHLHDEVKSVIRTLEKTGFIVQVPGVANDTIWKSVSGKSAEVRRFLESPSPKFARRILQA